MSVPACSGSCYFCRGEPATCGKTVARARCLPCGHTPMQCKTANMSPRALHGLRIHPTSSRTLQNHSKTLRKTQRPFQQHLRIAQRLLHNHNWFNSIHTKSSEYASIWKHCSCIHLLHGFTDPSETSEWNQDMYMSSHVHHLSESSWSELWGWK